MVVASEQFESKSEFEMFKCLLLEENIFKTQVKLSKAHALISLSRVIILILGKGSSVGGPLALQALKGNNSFTRGLTSACTRVR